MNRRLAFALVLVLAALAGVVGGAGRFLARDRAEAVERFSAERERQVGEAAREIGGELDEVGGALRVIGRLLQRSKEGLPRRELEALLAGSGQYRVLAVYGGTGERLLSLEAETKDGAGADPALVPAALEVAARDTLGIEARPLGPGERGETERPVERSGEAEVHGYPVSVPGGRGWSRIFSAAFEVPPAIEGGAPRRVAVAVLLDMPRLFDKLHRLAGDGSTRSFLVGGPGEPTAAGDPDTARALGEADDRPAARPDLAAVLRRMRGGDQGSVTVGAGEARALGLPSDTAVAAFAPIHGAGARRWSIATVSSTAARREHDRVLVRRIVEAAGAVSLLVCGFGAWLLVASRRALLLRERLRHADQLAHLHEMTEKVLDNVPTVVLVLTDEGRISAANRAARDRLPEGTTGQLTGARLEAAFPLAPAAVTARLSSLVSVARSAAKVVSLRGERLALHGEEGQYTVHAVPLEPRFPEARALLVIEDLSEVRMLETQLLRAEKLATIGALSAGIADEIGAPLGVVRGRAEYVLGKLGPGHPQAAGLGAIVEQVERVTGTVRRLLDFARVKPAAVEAVEVAPVARAVLELVRHRAERADVKLGLELAEPLPPVMADPDQLRQILVHLVVNGIDACEEGGKVALRAAPHQEPGGGTPSAGAGWQRVRIEVVDDGRGIPEELRHQVFDPYFTTKGRGLGTGLGLPLAAEIARNHGVDIEVESAPGRGTRLVLLWPVTEPGRI